MLSNAEVSFAAIYHVCCSSRQLLMLFTMFLALHVYFAAIHNAFHSVFAFLLLFTMFFSLHVHFGCY
jgi:hypothetical protein